MDSSVHVGSYQSPVRNSLAIVWGKLSFVTKRKCLNWLDSLQPCHKARLDDVGSDNQHFIFETHRKWRLLGSVFGSDLIVCTDTCGSFPANLLSQTNKASLQHQVTSHYWFTCMCYLNSKRLLGYTPSPGSHYSVQNPLNLVKLFLLLILV